MTIRRIEPHTRVTKAVVHGNTVYVSGQLGEGPTMTAQMQDLLAKIDHWLAEAGTSKANIVQAIIWITDMKEFAEMNAAWDAWVGGPYAPARATCSVHQLVDPKYKVEITVIAAL